MFETLLPIGLFISLVAVVLAVILVFRDIAAARRKARETEEMIFKEIEDESLRKILAKPDTRSDSSRWFDRLAEESNTGVSPVTIILLIFGGSLILGAIPLVFFDNLLFALLGSVLGAVLPMTVFMLIRDRRLARLQRDLPGTLEVLADALRAGHSLEQAIDITAEEVDDPLKAEFTYCSEQLHLGQSLIAAIERMQKRIPVTEFRIFLTAVIVHRQTGGNLALLAERLARASRDRIEFKSYIKAVSSGSRFSILGMLGAVLFGLLALATMRPEYLEPFFTTSAGMVMFVSSIILIIIGFFWTWRIMKVNY